MTAESTASSRWQRAQTVIARRVASETVLVPLGARASDPEFKGAQLFVLNDTGEYLWTLLETPRSSSELARNLTLQYETAEDSARSDVEAFLVAMRDIGAIREVTNAGAE